MWYPESGVVLDCIISESLPSFSLRYILLANCTLVAAVVKTQIVFSSHGGFLTCVTLESQFNKSAEKMLMYKKDSLLYYTQWSHRVWNTGKSS